MIQLSLIKKSFGNKDETRVMKIRQLIASMLISSIPLSSFAGWQVANPKSTVPREPFFQASSNKKSTASFTPSAYGSSAFPSQYANLGEPAPMYAVSISGSVKENLERIMGRYHWKVVWKAPYDYNFDGRVTGSSLPNVIEKLVQPFPLQAVMYMSNRTVMVTQRLRT